MLSKMVMFDISLRVGWRFLATAAYGGLWRL